MAAPALIAFLSSGRCGTRWLASQLRRLYPELEVEHEPIGPLYKPRLYFRRYRNPDAILAVPEVDRHIRRIERTTRSYVETGWPLFPALPLMAERFGERLRIVHLTRHPVGSALAHLTRAMYAGGPRRDRYTRWATLSPSDRNVFLSRYARSWERFTPYERCLYWWTEVNLFGLELPGRLRPIPYLRIQCEQLLGGDRTVLTQLLDFMGLPFDARWIDLASDAAERWPRLPDEYGDPLQVHRHPTTVVLAKELGYDLRALNRGALLERYERTGARGPHAGPDVIVKEP